MPSWTDPSFHNPTADDAPPPEWGDAVNDDLRHIYERTERVIASTVLSVAGTSISSGTLPAVAGGYMLRVLIEHQGTGGPGSAANVGVRFNGDSGANYWRQYHYANDASVVADAPASVAETSYFVSSASDESSPRWGFGELLVMNYLSATKHKTLLGRAFDPRGITAPLLLQTGGAWVSTAQITSVSAHISSGNFEIGSRLTVLALPLPA
jgi:hypothetical protein